MTKFEKRKAETIEACKKNDACRSELQRVIKSNSMKELLFVLGENCKWCIQHHIDITGIKLYLKE